MKKLVSVWIEVEKIESIKLIKNKSISEFVRESVNVALSPELAYKNGTGCEINMAILCIENNIPLNYADYAHLLSQFDSFYTGERTDFISDKETIKFAIISAKMLSLELLAWNITEHPMKYFTDYIWSANSDINRVELASCKIKCDKI